MRFRDRHRQHHGYDNWLRCRRGLARSVPGLGRTHQCQIDQQESHCRELPAARSAGGGSPCCESDGDGIHFHPAGREPCQWTEHRIISQFGHRSPSLSRICSIPASNRRCAVETEHPALLANCSSVRPPQSRATITSRCSNGKVRNAWTASAASRPSTCCSANQHLWEPTICSRFARRRCRFSASRATLRVTVNNQAAGSSGNECCAASLQNASCTASSGLSHH